MVVVYDGPYALGSILGRPDSQIIGNIEILGGCAWGKSPDLFSLEQVLFILRLNAENCAHEQRTRLIN